MKRIILSSQFFFLLIVALSFLTLLSSCTKEEIAPNISEENPTENSSINLQPTIGVFAHPADGDSITPIPLYLAGDYDVNSIAIGSQVPDFTFYDPSGVAHNLETILADGKPVFIMSGNITCPVFRGNISDLNSLISAYSDSINFFIAYTVEAHPIVDVSPYSGDVWTTNANMNAGILYEQPKTYGDRLDLIEVLTSNATINCDILVDGPCNEYWLNYGEAPNRAYVIDPTGKVVISHGWFDYPSMVTSIEDLLGL